MGEPVGKATLNENFIELTVASLFPLLIPAFKTFIFSPPQHQPMQQLEVKFNILNNTTIIRIVPSV